MVARATQAGAVQDADEERKGDVQEGTLTADRSRQRSNAPASTVSAAGSAGGQGSAVRGSLNTYEVAVLYHPDLEIDLEKASTKVEKIITDNGGKITNTDSWGKRKLAYPIKKNEFAVYVFYTVEMPAESVQKIEQTFNISDEIIRFLVTKPDLKAKAKAEALAAEKAKKAAERGKDENEAEDEEDQPRRRTRVELK
ncbi:30S ribosomal protein S6 [Candidatus Saccharibacteria bacterium]|nr:30S ribosomal protein S6 [Candidatus Saccharibacteria bacterium]